MTTPTSMDLLFCFLEMQESQRNAIISEEKYNIINIYYNMSMNVYCGIKKPPKGKHYGNEEECRNKGQIRRYGIFEAKGINALMEKTTVKPPEKPKELTKEEKEKKRKIKEEEMKKREKEEMERMEKEDKKHKKTKEENEERIKKRNKMLDDIIEEMGKLKKEMRKEKDANLKMNFRHKIMDLEIKWHKIKNI